MPFKKGETPKGAKPFKPGISGNPAGKEPGLKNRSTIARKWLDVKTKWLNPLTGIEELLTLEDQITLAQIKVARDEGTAISYKVVMDSAHGAVQQKVDMTTGGEIMLPTINIYNTAPPMASSEDEIER